MLARASSIWARVAVVGLAAGATLPLAMAIFKDFQVGQGAWATIFCLVAAAGALPHATVAVASRFAGLSRGFGRAAFTFGAAAFLIGGVMLPKTDEDVVARVSCFAAWLVATQLAFHAAATSSVRLRTVAIEVGAASAACAVALFERARSEGWGGGGPRAYALAPAIGWLLGVLLVPRARLGRSFTAVPLDHAIYSDFGGPRRP